jgi:hypothetical protein
MSQQWIQHRLGGTKWKLDASQGDMLICGAYRLPKADYVCCDPPEPPKKWTNITHDLVVSTNVITGKTVLVRPFQPASKFTVLELPHEFAKDGFRMRLMPDGIQIYELQEDRDDRSEGAR